MTALSPGSVGTYTATGDSSVKTATSLEFSPTFNAEQYSPFPLPLK
jgi:hypothetical protein